MRPRQSVFTQSCTICSHRYVVAWRTQICILVSGIVDACVYAHHHHCHKKKNPVHLDCMQGRFRTMTATTLAHAQAFQNTRPGRCAGDFHIHHYRLFTPAQNFGTFQVFGQQNALQVTTAEDEPSLLMEKIIRVMGDTTAGWRAVARSPRRICYVSASLMLVNNPTTSLSSQAMTLGPVPRDSRVFVFFDSNALNTLRNPRPWSSCPTIPSAVRYFQPRGIQLHC